ncbi:MAG TPA: MFS transporter, partial [Solirubrobacteraceae bacterium]|nr:MFS transporter [Solirubrobacteraceae bacterium]
NTLGFKPFDAGLRFLPITLLSFFAAPIAGRLSERMPVRILLGGGLALVGVGLALMHGLTTSSGWTALLAGFIVAGLGIGMVNPPLASTSIGVVEPQRSGMGSGINNTFRQVGIATGIAGLGAIFQHSVTTRVAHLLTGTAAGAGGQAHHIGQLVATGSARQAIESAPPSARSAVAHAVRVGFIGGLNEILLIGAVVAFAGAILSFALVRRRDFVVQGAPSPAAA